MAQLTATEGKDPITYARKMRICANTLFDELCAEYLIAERHGRVPSLRSMTAQLKMSLDLLEQAKRITDGEAVDDQAR